ncbi:hypothetical protein BJ166DRAFT_592305 [Pestalotiopsis sp. NC0098]|nr:hypothetical protein BJ166DRAFT_592305 [Pestalotiopsis sp. NC0098]
MVRDTEARKHMPFQPRMAKDAWVRYRVCVGQLLLYFWRTQQWQDADRPAYQMTPQQTELLCDLEELLEPQEPRKTRPPFRQGSKEQDRLDDLVPQLLLALFDHYYHTFAYESAIVSGLAVMGIRDNGGWDLAAKVSNGQDREEAIYSSQSLFERVRLRMDKFIVRAASKSSPSVMDWILSARTYGISIAFGTPADGHIQWDDHDRRVSYKRIQFTMDDLREMVGKLIEETKALVGDALCLETDATT